MVEHRDPRERKDRNHEQEEEEQPYCHMAVLRIFLVEEGHSLWVEFVSHNLCHSSHRMVVGDLAIAHDIVVVCIHGEVEDLADRSSRQQVVDHICLYFRVVSADDSFANHVRLGSEKLSVECYRRSIHARLLHNGPRLL